MKHDDLDYYSPSPELSLKDKSVKSLMERVLNKNAKTRLNAMSDMLTLFTNSNIQQNVLSMYLINFPKCFVYPASLEKAAEVFIALLKRLPKNVNNGLNRAVITFANKCFETDKESLKDRVIECFKILVSRENDFKEAMNELLTSKASPKVISDSINMLAQLLPELKSKDFPIDEFEGLVISLAESPNSQIRNEVLNYLKEAYKCKQIAPEKNLKESPEVNKSKPNVKEDNKNNRILELTKFSEQWCSQLLACKRWGEKRDKLEELLKAVSLGKVRIENFPPIGKILKTLLQDLNVVISSLSMRVIGEIAKNLKEDCEAYSVEVFELVVKKCKDKKTLVESQKCIENLEIGRAHV